MSADIITFFYSSVQNWSIIGGGRNCPKFSAVLHTVIKERYNICRHYTSKF